MNRVIVGTLSSVALLAAEATVNATVQGPRLGYVSSAEGIRAISGIVGAAQFSAPVLSDLTKAVILSSTDTAVGIDVSGKLAIVDLTRGATTTIDLPAVTSLHASTGGTAFLARTPSGLHTYRSSGTEIATYTLPGEPLRVALSDSGDTVAITVAEANGHAVYVLSPAGISRAFEAEQIVALAFAPARADLAFLDAAGNAYRLKPDLQVERLATVPGAKAVAADQDRVLVVAGSKIHSVPFESSTAAASVDCPCDAGLAEPLGRSKFLIAPASNGPAWILDASSAALRVAFIPEPAND